MPDATVGGGGHSALLLAAHPGLRLIGLDQDPAAWRRPLSAWNPSADRVSLVPANFATYAPSEPLVGVLADLGVSSPQLDRPSRGSASASMVPWTCAWSSAEGERPLS